MIMNYMQTHFDTLVILSIISITAFMMSLLCTPLIIIRLPDDFFIKKDRCLFPHLPFFMRVSLFLIKNAAGALLLTAGIIMLFIPGQGLLTIILGLALMDFPFKKRAETRLLRLHPVQYTLNWIRKRNNLPVFRFP